MIKIKHISNSGFLLEGETWRLLVDALYEPISYKYNADKPNQRLPLTEYPSEDDIEAMVDCKPPYDDITAYLASHFHPDHGNLDMIARVKNLSIPVLLPETERFHDQIKSLPNNKIVLTEPIEIHQIGDVVITAIWAKHDGSSYFALETYSFLIETPEGTVFFAGDSLTSDAGLRAALVEFTREKKIDIAFINYPEISRDRGRELIKEYIKPGHLFLSHLPEPDENGKRDVGRLYKSLEQYGETLPTITICEGGELEY